MKIIQNKYKKVADLCYDLFEMAEIPLHFSKYSNKLYTNYSHMFLLVYKQARKFTYEQLMEDLGDNSTLRAYLGLNKLPHYSTLVKFAQKLPMKVWDKILLAFKKIIMPPKKVAIDATGITLDNASPHYCKRIGRKTKKRPFLKSTFVVDIEQYLILLCKFRKKARHDTKDAKPMVKKMAKYYLPKIFYGDRGYDDNALFTLIIEKLKAYPLILQRRLDVPKHRRSGRYRKEKIDVFDYGEYLQRNKVECVISMFKRRFGANVKSKDVKCQKVEAITRVIAFNIDRVLRIGENVILIFIRITRVSY
jgi:hypothetical protein